ncbi:histidine kinase/DNA gyrase B/HSP90-like ATPase [Anseongella ginsenosidimutans]|uniref:histidine kinase n=1 Tax=Anseongella ginsenosidimutans TaxID=496056 RepID=A0A4R3KQI0_9SPHI|nr:ATP-binding protein [Anseongella ginsenosidimutans]QEC52634.1 GHKL domain-containing protein [Anseongella ginsenosidimutans]TCS86557.1 histidine kinase/DNA gyrase B/HSP90-like ATPase [Anseongella ginsenosidimutans]
MAFERFSISLFLRILGIAAGIGLFCWALMQRQVNGSFRLLLLIIPFLLTLWQCYSLHHYITRVNRKLALFLESIHYSDFSIRFSSDNKLGKSFRDLNRQFNQVLEAFREARAEKEANLKYIDTIVQQINIGVLSFDSSGKVELINPAAFRLLGIYRLRNIAELENSHDGLANLFWRLPSGSKSLYPMSQNLQLSVSATGLRLQGKLIKLVSLQNIHSELQDKELEAWQNLARILRHEIMNSITPIVSLIGTMKEIVENDLQTYRLPENATADLREALQTVENRSRGIMNFVNAYRDYTSLPKPHFSTIRVKDIIHSVTQLMDPDLKQEGIQLRSKVQPGDLEITADGEQLHMVLINLIKNARDALLETPDGVISLKAFRNQQQVILEISDNGPGIEAEAMENIFIPFFTTKKKGSGIGLSLSRQIIQLHGGQLRAHSVADKGSTFSIILEQ